MNHLTTILVNVDRRSQAIFDKPVEFGLLSDAHQREMRKLRMQGRTIEVWSSSVDGWREADDELLRADKCYRIKPTPNELRISELEDELLALDIEISRRKEELNELLR